MLRQCFIVIICGLCFLPLHARICEEVLVFNTVSEFEPNLRGCTMVIGFLRIVMERAKFHEFENISFPELTEIRGYLMLYRVHGLTTLGKLFPNLSVIRGTTLFTDYSLILRDLPHLQEIGLRSLKYIARGSTRIQNCPNLCYVDTINWSYITDPSHRLDYYDTNKYCNSCPSECNGLCWNENHCQLTIPDHCDSECYGCSEPMNPKRCYACKNYRDEHQCVSRCPNNKILHSTLGYCITEEECPTTLNGTWWTFQGHCINSCPAHYQQVTEEGGCVYCGDNCIKSCIGILVDTIEAAQELVGCTHIVGSLSIRVFSKSAADELEESLGMIEEIDGYLKVYRSYPLTSLEFMKSLRVIHGRMLENKRHSLIVFENQNLHKLWDWNNFNVTIKEGTISFHYNPMLCLKEIERLSTFTGVEFSSIDVSSFSNGDKTSCNQIDLNPSIKNLNSKTIIISWDVFPVDENQSVIGYLLYYIEDPSGNMTIYDESDDCGTYGWDSIFVSNNFKEIDNLQPFTKYAYYIKTYTSPASIGGQTRIQYFTTLSDDPSIPLNIKSSTESSDSILLTWLPPKHTNGILNFYHLTVHAQEDDNRISLERNFCQHPHVLYHNERKPEPTVDLWSKSTANSTCCNKEEKPVVDSFEDFCNLLEPTDSILKLGGCKKYEKLNDNSMKPMKINPNVTSYLVQNLSYFTNYIFLLRACNNESQCSSSVLASNRTLKKIEADYIPHGLTAAVINTETVFEWPEPEEPNSMIVAYQLQYKRVDLENSKNVTDCISQRNFTLRGKKYVIHLSPGHYSVRVKAISLAGEGRFTEPVTFAIELGDHGVSPVAIVVPVLVVTFCIFGAVYYYFYKYKPKHKLDDLHLIANVNPDYVGPIYVEDEWEMDRKDVEINKELGQGTFGMVYSGFIKSQNRPCAVKTANTHTNVDDKMSFLNEASVMKSFSDAHHVVKLLGVVSKGQPPFVVMELMTRGDLKSFLRRSRDSSSTLTCAEMYRMAAEIADGMMYLAAKKFVHRDLAARNCMVGADFTVKIGDFGMTRDIYETDYYRKETRGLMPVRWMSPESLADGVFTTDSDIWSYGVVLWEMATLAEQPYQGLANEQVLQFVIAQGTLERPHECPDLLYEIMEACWKWKPSHRPLFKDIVEKLEPNVGQNFRLVSFYHSSDGEDYRLHCKDRVYNPPALAVPLGKNSAVYWNTSNDNISIYSMESKSSRPTPLLSSFENQSRNMPSGSSYR